MGPRNALLALTTGLSTFLVAGVAATELLSTRIWPSLLVGIPAGVAAGLAGAAFVYRGLAPGSRRRRSAIAAASFGVAFLVVLPAAALGLQLRNTLAFVLAVGVGTVVAVAVYARPSVVEARVA
jgi:hypothetical protein